VIQLLYFSVFFNTVVFDDIQHGASFELKWVAGAEKIQNFFFRIVSQWHFCKYTYRAVGVL